MFVFIVSPPTFFEKNTPLYNNFFMVALMKKMKSSMKKISTSVVFLMAAAILAVACSKPEEPKVPENKLVGAWKAPLNMTDGTMNAFGGKPLTINANHTATFSYLAFDNWKIEGDQLILTNLSGEGLSRRIEVLRYTIENYVDTAMLLTGKYILAVGDSVYQQGDLSGLYKRDKGH